MTDLRGRMKREARDPTTHPTQLHDELLRRRERYRPTARQLNEVQARRDQERSRHEADPHARGPVDPVRIQGPGHRQRDRHQPRQRCRFNSVSRKWYPTLELASCCPVIGLVMRPI